MKSLKSLLSLTALTLAISSSALANENPLSALKDVAKDSVKTSVSENVKSVKDSASSVQDSVLEQVSSVKDKMNETKDKVNAVKEKAKSLKNSASTESNISLKEKAAEKVKATKEKAAEKLNSVKDKVKSDVNKADARTLQQLSGIGEKKAQAIIDYRNKVGKIKDIAELSKIDGLGSTTIEKIAPLLNF